MSREALRTWPLYHDEKSIFSSVRAEPGIISMMNNKSKPPATPPKAAKKEEKQDKNFLEKTQSAVSDGFNATKKALGSAASEGKRQAIRLVSFRKHLFSN